MRLKTYTAASMAEAMRQIRGELGEDAIIVSSETGRGGRAVRVVAAVDETESDEPTFAGWRDEEPVGAATAPDGDVGRALRHHGVPAGLAGRLGRAAATLAQPDTIAALTAALEGSLGFQPMADRLAPRPLMLVGPPGVGKTTVAAKLIVAAHRRGRKVVAVTCDTTRAGGVEQLEAFTRILGLELLTADTPQALARILGAANGSDVIIDTAGASPLRAADMAALRVLVDHARAEPLLVLAAGADALEAGDSAAAFAAIGCRRMIATRLDVARRLGALLCAADVGRLAFAGATAGAHAADAVGPLGAVALARLLLSPITSRVTAVKAREAS
jgi:flagellar biosynthesis protein FlhF